MAYSSPSTLGLLHPWCKEELHSYEAQDPRGDNYDHYLIMTSPFQSVVEYPDWNGFLIGKIQIILIGGDSFGSCQELEQNPGTLSSKTFTC